MDVSDRRAIALFNGSVFLLGVAFAFFALRLLLLDDGLFEWGWLRLLLTVARISLHHGRLRRVVACGTALEPIAHVNAAMHAALGDCNGPGPSER